MTDQMARAALPGSTEDRLVISTSLHFDRWLSDHEASLAFTTYQAGKLFMIGAHPDGGVSVYERTFERAMGLAVSDDCQTIALASTHSVQRFDNIISAEEAARDGYDALYAPHAGWVTGDLDIHDMGFGSDGRPLFVNTLFNCIATVSDSRSFRPVWRPKFISQLVAEDRCHLNGMAMSDGKARYVTAVSRSDVADGWRDRRTDGGIVVDVDSGEIVCGGLSMPHSPRLYQDRLWLLNSGTGELGHIDIASGRFEPLAFCPGYARGLAFAGNHAIVGLSLAGQNRTFAGLRLDAALKARNVEPRCGLAVIDLSSGQISAWMRIEGVVNELYDVAVLRDVRRPSLLGFKSDEVKFVLSIEA